MPPWLRFRSFHLTRCFRALAVVVIAGQALAGDFSDGPNRYELDLAAGSHQYTMTAADHRWAESLLRNLHQKGHVTYLTRTDIPFVRDGERVNGGVYCPVGKFTGRYYVPEGDAVILVPEKAVISQGCGGFSIHAPKSRNFIVALYFETPCVPILRHGEIQRGKIWFYSSKSFDRFALDQ